MDLLHCRDRLVTLVAVRSILHDGRASKRGSWHQQQLLAPRQDGSASPKAPREPSSAAAIYHREGGVFRVAAAAVTHANDGHGPLASGDLQGRRGQKPPDRCFDGENAKMSDAKEARWLTRGGARTAFDGMKWRREHDPIAVQLTRHFVLAASKRFRQGLRME